MRKNNKLIVIIGIIFSLAIMCAILAYMFIMTDVFKSNKELFFKYFSQNTEIFEKITDIQAINCYKNFKNKEKNELNTVIKTVHSVGGEISNPLNNLSAKLDIQKNNDEQYMYTNAQVLYEDERYLNVELIKEQDQYGVRFSDVAKKFVTIQNNENIETIANDIGIQVSQFEEIIKLIDGNTQFVTEEQKKVLQDKYLNIIISGILNGTFEKQKNALITYNNVTTETNAYSVSLGGEQIKNVVIEILNNAKNENNLYEQFQAEDKENIMNMFDEVINNIIEKVELPDVKLTVYENKKQTIRTVLESGTFKITIENKEQNSEIKTNISYTNNEQNLNLNGQITNTKNSEQEVFEIILGCFIEEQNFTITFLNEMQKLENETNINTKISHKQDITTTSIEIQNKIKNNFEKTQSLTQNNYVQLNSLEEETRKQFINQLKERIAEKTNEKIELLSEKLGLIDEASEKEENIADSEVEGQMPQTEINKFNAKFEFYTGDKVSAENVRALLDVVKNNIAGHTINVPEINEENTETVENTSLTIQIEKDKTNENSMTEIANYIKDNKKYNVSIIYKQSNGLIDYIQIDEL